MHGPRVGVPKGTANGAYRTGLFKKEMLEAKSMVRALVGQARSLLADL